MNHKKHSAAAPQPNVDDVAVWTELECVIFPSSQRRARSASPIARSRNSGQFGWPSKACRTDHPVRDKSERILWFLMSRTPLLCEEGNVLCRKLCPKNYKLHPCYTKDFLFCASRVPFVPFVFRSRFRWANITEPLPLARSFHDDLPEFGIGDQAAGRGSLDFDRVENRGSLGFRYVQPEFLRLQCDAVQTAFFAQHDLPLRSHEFSRVGLDRFGHMELAGDGAALADE